jgi:transposase
MTVKITRLSLSAADLREEAAATEDAKTARRMLAIALLLDGWSREAAAEACAMDRQTLRDWVHRYNESGLDGLSDRPRRFGPPPRLSAEQEAKVAEWVQQGPELERDGVVRWRCIDLRQRI